MTRLPAHIPVTIGDKSPVVVEVTNPTKVPQTGRVALQLPPGWKADADNKPYALAPGGVCYCHLPDNGSRRGACRQL